MLREEEREIFMIYFILMCFPLHFRMQQGKTRQCSNKYSCYVISYTFIVSISSLIFNLTVIMVLIEGSNLMRIDTLKKYNCWRLEQNRTEKNRGNSTLLTELNRKVNSRVYSSSMRRLNQLRNNRFHRITIYNNVYNNYLQR